MLASEALDDLAPFETPLEEYDVLPDALLDYVSLYAHELRREQEDPPPATRIKAGDVTVDLKSQTSRRLERLVAPYLKRTGRVA
jgi:hypothetical protein